jgi:hypothetical protein
MFSKGAYSKLPVKIRASAWCHQPNEALEMLFLLNDQIVDIAVPEAHLSMRWKGLGCDDPYGMRASEALDFAAGVVNKHLASETLMEPKLVEDLAALIIAKTGANAALFPKDETGLAKPRLTILPESILEQLKSASTDGAQVDVAEIWPLAA